MNRRVVLNWLLGAALLLPGCAIYDRHGLPPEQAQALEARPGPATFKLSPELKKRILALDPEHVTAADITNTLALCPARTW